MPTPAERFYKPTPTQSTCQVCDRPGCDGLTNEIRHFHDWSDLCDHLDEATIVTFINRLAEIGEEYLTLREAENERQAYRHARQTFHNSLIKFAKGQLNDDEVAKLRADAEEKAMRTVGKGGKVLHKATPATVNIRKVKGRK